MTKLIISDAHEVVQTTPLSASQYKCLRCNLIGSLENLFGVIRCTLHFETASSGWKDMSKNYD